ncbi:hypothetical protein HAX54_017847, partial [Datura stramonium]|nr:hypothetical protein [Datura stramonium]
MSYEWLGVRYESDGDSGCMIEEWLEFNVSDNERDEWSQVPHCTVTWTYSEVVLTPPWTPPHLY